MKEAKAILKLHQDGLTTLDRPHVGQALYDKAKDVVTMHQLLAQAGALLRDLSDNGCVKDDSFCASIALSVSLQADEINEFLERNP